VAHWFFFALTAFAFAGIIVWDVITPPPAGGDPFIYNLTFPASWLKRGEIFYVSLPYGAQAATYYPLNTEIYYLWMLLPWHGDFLVNLGQVPFWIAGGMGVAFLARQGGTGRPGSIFSGLLAMFIPGVIQQATVPRVDLAFSTWLVFSIYFALRWGQTMRRWHLALFGISLGLLIGTKSLGVVYCTIPVVLFLFHWGGRGRKVIIDSLIVAALVVIAGGFWYIRNWVVTGNPFFPLNVEVAGRIVFAGAYSKQAMQVFHVEDPAELREIGRFFLNIWLLLYITVSSVLAMVLVLLRKREGPGKLFVLSAPWVVILLFWYVNPHNNLTNGRFLFPAFILLCYYAAVMVNKGREWWAIFWALLGVAAVVGSGLMYGTDHIYLLLRDIIKTAAGSGTELLAPAAVAVRLLAVSALVFVAFLAIRRGGWLKLSVGLAASALLVAGMWSAWGYHIENKYKWYGAFPVGRAWAKLDTMSAGRSVRIASVGAERSYGLFGTELKNDVLTVSISQDPSVDFHHYWRKALEKGDAPSNMERPQWHRENGSHDAWLANLRRREVDIVFATVLEPMARGAMIHDSRGFPIEVEWAESDKENFRQVRYYNPEVRIYELKK